MTKIEIIALTSIGIAAFLLRVWGSGFGLPYDYHPDEPLVIETALRLVATGNLNPGTFIWPPLVFYLNTLAYFLFFLFGKLVGWFPSRQEFLAYFTLDPSVFIVIPRLISALFGTLSIGPLYLLGKALGHVKVGFLAATLLAVSPFHIEHAHFGTVDITLTFFILLSTYSLYLSYTAGRIKDYLLFGLFSGLATATKYPAGLLVIALCFLTPLLLSREEGNPWYRSYRPASVVLPLLSLGAFLLTFVVVAPYTVIDFPTFWREFSALSTLTSQEWLGGEGIGSRFVFYARLLLVNDLGPIASVLWAIGVAIFSFQQPRIAIVLLAFPALYYCFFGASANVHARFALPLLPSVLLFTAYGTWQISEVRVMNSRWLQTVILLVIALVLVSHGVTEAVKIAHRLSQPDTRTIAKEWIEAHIPSGSRITTEYYGPPLADFQQERQRSYARRILTREPRWRDWLTKHVPLGRPFYHVVVIPVPSPRTASAVAQTFYSFPRYVEDGTDFIVVDSNMFGRYLAAPEKYPLQNAFYTELQQRCELIQQWNPQELSSSGPAIKMYRVPRPTTADEQFLLIPGEE